MSDSSVEVLLKISCRGLKNKDTFSKSDPFVVVSEDKKVIGKTETIKDNLNPTFNLSIPSKYYFEKVQRLTFEIRDDDGKGKFESLGNATVVLCDIVTAAVDGKELPVILNGRPYGTIRIIAREVPKGMVGAFVRFYLGAAKLDKKDFFGKSDPYILLYNTSKNGKTDLPVYKSEIIKNTLDPTFKVFQLPLTDIGEEKIRLEIWDWDRNSKDEIIGSCEINIQDYKGSSEVGQVEMTNPTKKSGKKSGTLLVKKIFVYKNYSFLDYIQSGTQMCFSVAIDFTASNGDTDKPGSLHYIGTPQQPCQTPTLYEQAIQSIAGLLEYYDNDKLFPCYGFGARFPNGKVFHDFHVNGNDADPNIQGIANILKCYRNCLTQVRLFGPTNCAPIIYKMINCCKTEGKGAEKYFVLLICTDGEITDMDETIEAIIAACGYPLSIIIVGVGNADFNKMNLLDGDEKGLQDSKGNIAPRDIVQFVAMRDYTDQNAIYNKLPADLLEEVPKQLTEYMLQNELGPVFELPPGELK